MSVSEKIDKLIARVNLLSDIADAEIDVSWGVPSSPEAIESLENSLDIKLPNSFRQFLLKTGGGGIDALAISGVPPDAPLEDVYGTVFGDTQHYREPWVPHKLPVHLVVIQRDRDDNEPFCLDTSKMLNDECPVVLFYHQSTGHVEYIASSFIEFYSEYLSPYFSEAGI